MRWFFTRIYIEVHPKSFFSYTLPVVTLRVRVITPGWRRKQNIFELDEILHK